MQSNVLEYFLATETRFPSKNAVISDGSAWTFAELGKRARALAAEIAARTDARNMPVAVYLPKSKEAIASFLGILFSGNCYAPLDIKVPAARIEATLKNLQPVLVITSEALRQSVLSCGVHAGLIVTIESLSDNRGTEMERWRESIDTDPVYILHTSGSTGVPKGVVISHRSVIDYIDWARDAFQINETTVIGNQAPLVFDNSTLDIYLSFATGAELNLIPETLFLFPLKLMEYVAQRQINFIFWVPSAMISVANAQVLSRFPLLALTKILFAGEVMPARQLQAWRARFPQALFANLYGPTEITVDCTYYVVDRDFADDENIPIGIPCRNSDVLILNDDNQRCIPGEHGELCVRGSSLALGYWNQPAQTGKAFVQNPLNTHYPELIYRTGDLVYTNDTGEIIFVGRKDSQVKHMGYRIELGEIETAARQVSGVRNACVLYDGLRSEIVLIYEAEQELELSFLRIELSRRVPKYMLPTVVRRVSDMPKNTSGKVDRKELSVQYAS